MGCWNGTCALTNLPIHEGDKVALYILKKTDINYNDDDIGGGFCYSDSFYTPLPFVIYGEYDDYGCIGNIEDNITLIEEYFKQIGWKENPDSDDKGIIRNIERGNVKGYTFLMVHREVHDLVIDNMANRTNWWTDNKTIKQYLIDKVNENIIKYNLNKEDYKDIKVDGLNTSILYKVDRFISDLDSSNFFVNKYLEGGLPANLWRKLIDYALICKVFTSSRKFWFPQTGAGSQDSEYELLEIMADFVKDKTKRYNENQD